MNVSHMVGDGVQRVVLVATPSAYIGIQMQYFLCFEAVVGEDLTLMAPHVLLV